MADIQSSNKLIKNSSRDNIINLGKIESVNIHNEKEQLKKKFLKINVESEDKEINDINVYNLNTNDENLNIKYLKIVYILLYEYSNNKENMSELGYTPLIFKYFAKRFNDITNYKEKIQEINIFYKLLQIRNLDGDKIREFLNDLYKLYDPNSEQQFVNNIDTDPIIIMNWNLGIPGSLFQLDLEQEHIFKSNITNYTHEILRDIMRILRYMKDNNKSFIITLQEVSEYLLFLILNELNDSLYHPLIYISPDKAIIPDNKLIEQKTTKRYLSKKKNTTYIDFTYFMTICSPDFYTISGFGRYSSLLNLHTKFNFPFEEFANKYINIEKRQYRQDKQGWNPIEEKYNTNKDIKLENKILNKIFNDEKNKNRVNYLSCPLTITQYFPDFPKIYGMNDDDIIDYILNENSYKLKGFENNIYMTEHLYNILNRHTFLSNSENLNKFFHKKNEFSCFDSYYDNYINNKTYENQYNNAAILCYNSKGSSGYFNVFNKNKSLKFKILNIHDKIDYYEDNILLDFMYNSRAMINNVILLHSGDYNNATFLPPKRIPNSYFGGFKRIYQTEFIEKLQQVIPINENESKKYSMYITKCNLEEYLISSQDPEIQDTENRAASFNYLNRCDTNKVLYDLHTSTKNCFNQIYPVKNGTRAWDKEVQKIIMLFRYDLYDINIIRYQDYSQWSNEYSVYYNKSKTSDHIIQFINLSPVKRVKVSKPIDINRILENIDNPNYFTSGGFKNKFIQFILG
jgi:hypothetical protein